MLLSCVKIWYRADSNVLKFASVQSTASVDRSTVSTLSALTKVGSPWSDHSTCIHKCSSAMEFLNWPLSWLPSQLFGIRSLTLYGLAVSAGPAESLCMAPEMLLITSSLPLMGVCIPSRTRCKESTISCLICCCNVIKSAVATPACCCATAAAAAISRASECLHLRWRSAALHHHDKCNSILWQS